MARYVVTLTRDEIQELKVMIQTGGKGYRTTLGFVGLGSSTNCGTFAETIW